MTTHFSLKKQLQLVIKQVDTQFHLEAIDDHGRMLPPDELVSYLFFHDEQTFYGMTVEVDSVAMNIKLQTHQLLSIFPELHPFIELVDPVKPPEHALPLAIVRQTAMIWHEEQFWNETSMADDATIQIDYEKLGISAEAGTLLTNAIYGRLHEANISASQFHTLLPHLQQFGWPNVSTSTMPLRVALRLTEPDDIDTDDDHWLLETVIVNERGRHWTPALSKKTWQIAKTLPARWQQYSEQIEQKHAELLAFLQTLPIPQDGAFLSYEMSDREVRYFLQEDLPILQSFQFPVILPAWLRSITETKMRVQTTASVQNYQSTTGLDEVLSFDWNFSLAGQQISRDHFQRLVEENREYIRAGDEWFHIDPAWLKKIRELMEKADDGEWTVKDLLFQEIPEEIVPDAAEDEDDQDDSNEMTPFISFSMQASLRNYMEMLAEKKDLPVAGIPDALQATLRPYQEDGFNWLMFMRNHQFGACLADDMGLGKTIQLITYLLKVHGDSNVRKRPSLIICPTSVLGNWQKELERFAPSLKVHLHYGPSRQKGEAFTNFANALEVDVILTTYGTASQDGELLAETTFSSITLDEAQNIKNMQTKQSRAIRKLTGEHHIALTGTPIENRLSELWAIFDFIHRGYFGNFRSFTDEFIVPIERDDIESVKQKLRAKIRPFLLRRTKNDEELQLNLPKKLEQNEYCPLTPEQAALYESFVDETKYKLETLSGFEKKGLVLTMLNRLKQLCNHPSLFLKEPEQRASELVKRSEKLRSIVSMASTIAQNNEQCIIFTQYIGMGKLLQQCLTELHGIDVPFLTGSMAKSERDRLVEAFQQGEYPVFILSLRAGGTGLNLTAANHVLHADRWWNPAIENQATDRAYRIGQTKFVHVHKFVTIGTIEEKIDQMLQEKASLSADLILSNQWLADLSDQELDELLTFKA
ncbi:MAG TPA: DEAD/DEAH box helicase [Sporosarcina sp.]|nr:DEAD/DEAH box helicase [Sporosarcina sp.]